MKPFKGRPRHQVLGYLMVITAALLFGLTANLASLLFDAGITPVTLVELRMLIGGLGLLLFTAAGWRKLLRVPSRQWGWLIAYGLSIAFVTFCYFFAISRLPIAIVVVIQFSAAAWMTLAQIFWKRRIPSWQVAVAILCTLIGTVFLTGAWQSSINGLDGLGLLAAIGALVTFTAYLVLGQRIGRSMPSLTGTTYAALIAGLFWLIVQPPWQIPVLTWTPSLLAIIVVVGIFGMAVPFTLELLALRYIDATRVGVATSLEIVAASAIAYFWLKQQLDLWQIVGCILVLGGVTILQSEQPVSETGDVQPPE